MNGLLLLAVCVLVSVEHSISQPADCPILKAIIPQCDCDFPLGQPNDIVIYCKGKGLTSMPVINGSYSGVIYEFTLANNEIDYLPDNAFQGLNVQRLDLTNNKLTNISEAAFQDLESSLIVLKISGNPLNSPEVPFSAIKNLRGLQELLLQNFVSPSANLENSTYFQPFTNLLKLTLDNLGINSIGSRVFIGLRSLKEMNIRRSLITYPGTAMREVRATIETISVTNTQITSVQFYSFFEFSNLRKVDLSSNQISELEEDCFIGVETSLETLILDNNNIPQDQLKEVGKLTALKVLSLHTVGLSVLSQNSGFLHNKTNLMELNLAGNVLTSLPDNIFRDLNSLTKLELSGNEIRTMADNSLAGLSSLQTLNLDSQEGSGQLTLPLMFSLTSLRTLVLENTVITTPSWTRLRDAATLVSLRMRKGQISTIPPFAFQKMTNLEYLDLTDNQISQINQETFVGPRNTLKTIYLNQNSITAFDHCTFSNYSVSVTLELDLNPLRCDCLLSWLLVAVNNGKVILNELTKCASPSSLNGRKFTSLTPSDLCPTEPDVPTCSDYYTTTTTSTTAGPTTTPENIVIRVVDNEINVGSITISWTISKPVDSVRVIHTDIETGKEVESRPLSPILEDYTITDLKSGTVYQICVDAHRGGNLIKKECRSFTTRTLTTPASTTQPTSNNEELGIIIGSVIGGLVLLAILVAIIYVMVVRKKPPKDKYAVEPRNFKKAEMPTTGYDSKRYRKKKKDETDGNKNNVKVNVISDGKTAPNVGRASVGSYQYLQDNKGVSGRPNPSYENDAVARSNYENDQSLRPLPHMPRDSAGYYTHSPNDSADQPHMYSEIKL